MWDQLLSNPATRAYLMRFPPSTWEEKTVEAVQSAVAIDKRSKQQRVSQTTKRKQGADRGEQSDIRRVGHSTNHAQTHKSSRGGGGTAVRAVVSSPALPAQSVSVVSLPEPPPYRYPLVRPLTPNNPIVTGHSRPLTYADEYYHGNPYRTTAADIGGHVQYRDWPHRIGRNERNYSSATLLHHHSYPNTELQPRRADERPQYAWSEERRSTVDEAVQTTVLPASAHSQTALVEAELDDEASVESEPPVSRAVNQRAAGRGWRYVQQKGNDITINVQYQNSPDAHKPQQPHTHTHPAASSHYQPPSPNDTSHTVNNAGAQLTGQNTHSHTAARIVTAPSSDLPAGVSTSRVVPPPPHASTPFYSSASDRRPLLHPSYSHPHSVYPAWWPSEEDRLAEERREEAGRREEERRQRRRDAKQRELNERVRPFMDHTCPPPPPLAREGVAERKEDRQREITAGGMLALPAGGSAVNILAADPSSLSFSSHSSTSSLDRIGRQQSSLLPAPRPAAIVHSRIKPLLDRDRRQPMSNYDKWARASAVDGSITPASVSHAPDVPAASSTAESDYASLIRSLAADPIVASFASQQQQHTVPLSAVSSDSDESRASLSSVSSRAAVVAAAASVSSAAALAAIDRLDNVNRDSNDDRLGARREWDNIAATQAAAQLNRPQQRWQPIERRDVEVEDVSDDSETERQSLGRTASHSHSADYRYELRNRA